jgi:hypothetical protein
MYKIDRLIPDEIKDNQYIIEENTKQKTINDLSTWQRRALATKIKSLSPEEKKRLRYITSRMKIALKNGLIDGSAFGLLLAGIGAILGGPVGAGIGGAVGALAAGPASAHHAYHEARRASDLQSFGGKEEIKELQKEFEDILGKPIAKLFELDGKIRYSS